MHLLRRLYCRVFQGAFRLALPVLPYRSPERLHAVEEIPPLCKKLGAVSVLLVTDAGIRGAGLTEPLERALAEAGISCWVYDRTVPNPTIQNVEEARALYLEQGAQAIIAFGGGSSMDCAKAAGARVVKPRQGIPRMRGLLKVHRRLPPLIAVPTTAGTGSETTLAAVITDPQAHHKYPINDFSRVTLGLPLAWML